MRSLKFIVPLASFALLVMVLWRGLRVDPHEVPSPLVGKLAPVFAVAQLHDTNRMIGRDDMIGKVWLLNVWASWCAACRMEHPTLLALANTKTVPIIGLNFKDTRNEGLNWLNEVGNPYDASAFDPQGRIGLEFGVYGVPETFVIDKRGVIRHKQIGPLTPEIVQTRLQPLLKELNESVY
ncbi:Thiol:disulfide interchange protein DsbE [compost metagenome]